MFSGWGDWWDRPGLTNCNGLSKMELDRPLESGWIQDISAVLICFADNIITLLIINNK